MRVKDASSGLSAWLSPLTLVCVMLCTGPCHREIDAAEEEELPRQLTCRLTEQDVHDVLDRAIKGGDVLLIDRVAWRSKSRTAVQEAEDYLTQRRGAFLRRFRATVSDGAASVPPCGIAVGHYRGYGAVFGTCKAAPRGELPEGIYAGCGKGSVDNYGFGGEYFVVVAASVKLATFPLAFEILLLDAYAEQADPRGKAPVGLTLNVLAGEPTVEDVANAYATASWHRRRWGDLMSRLMKGGGEMIDRDLVQAQRTLKKASEHQGELRMYVAVLVAMQESKDAAVSEMARTCRRIVSQTLTEWDRPGRGFGVREGD